MIKLQGQTSFYDKKVHNYAIKGNKYSMWISAIFTNKNLRIVLAVLF